MKVAIALFIKNEQQDIASWISWHIALGIDKLFIFDDHSTDGTYEIIKATTNIYNIELHQTQPHEIPYFFDRQRDAYFKACKMAEEQGFEWIAFLDGDEYVSLEADQTIQDYLCKFNDFNGIALNWKIYGSSKRVFKTKLPTYEAFTHHCSPDLSDCTLIKSFIRPSAYTYHYTDPHHFHLNDEKYADALGNAFEWTGNATKQILWQGAHINHYICRSMEHYIQRIKRRVNADMVNSTDNWQHFNRNDIYSPENPNMIIKSNQVMCNIEQECIQQFIQSISENMSALPQSQSQPQSEIKVFSFRTFFNTVPGISKDEEFLAVYNPEDVFLKIFGVVYMSSPDIIYLFYIKNDQISNIPFIIRNEQKITSSYAFLLEHAINSNDFSLKSPTNNKYVTFPPNVYEHIQINRDNAQDWEFVSLHEEDANIAFCCCPQIINDKETFIAYLQKNREKVTYADFILAFNQLSSQERTEIINNYPNGKLLSWI